MFHTALGRGVHLVRVATEKKEAQEAQPKRRTTMTVILVLLMFGTLIVIDYIRNRNKAPQTAAATVPRVATGISLGDFVEGFHVPENLRYHP
jgi:hypothetical protein